MSDITNLFKATIKTVKTREKLLNASLVDKSILPKSSKKSEFTQSAKNVVLLISKLKEFLLDNRKDYLNAAGFFGLEQSAMNDLERDRIDTEAEAFMKMCKEAIHQLKLQSESHKVLRQVRKHKEGVLGVIERYLVAVCQMYSEQKAVRVKRMVDKKRMARLQTDPINKFVTPIRENPAEDEKVENNSRQINKTDRSDAQNKLTSTVRVSESSEVQGHKEGNLSADETMMLQMENDQIFNELSTMVDEIKQVEGKIVEISRLQNIFAEKILEQEQDIGKVAETVVMTTENIKEANEVIREAMKNNAGFRVWILFFLVVCTLSLLFLDWYNA